MKDYFNTREWQTLKHCLRVAVDRFVEDARICREAHHPLLAEEFDSQAKESRRLADIIEANE